MRTPERTERAAKDLADKVRNMLKSPWSLDESEDIDSAHSLFVEKPNRRNLHNLESGGYTSKLVMEDLRQIRASLPNHRIPNERLKELADLPAKTYAISEISAFINTDPDTLGTSLRSFVMNTKNCSTYDELKIARLRTKSTMDFPK